MLKLDWAILKLVMRLAYWIDYKFHKNNYLVASYINKLCALCLIGICAVSFLIFKHDWFPKILVCLINPLLAWAKLYQSDKLRTASDKWERSPGTIPAEVYGFILFPPKARLMGIFMGIFFAFTNCLLDVTTLHTPIWLGVIEGFFWLWTGYDSIAMYFAAIPPSTRKRKEKKAMDWSFGLTPSPVGSK